MKRCPKCRRELALDAFGICRREVDGRQTYCRDCRRVYRQDNHERIAAKKRANYEAKRESVIARVREQYQRNRDEILLRRRTAYALNPRLRLDENRVRQALTQGASGAERVLRDRVLERDRGVCGICGLGVDPSDWHLDHVVPLSRGGTHTYSNVQTTHPHCNLAKGAKPPNVLRAAA